MRSIFDSGTNISLISLKTHHELTKMGINGQALAERTDAVDLGFVQFGKSGAQSKILLIIKAGGLLETYAVVEDVDVNLTSVGWFTQARDMVVSFNKHTVDCIYKDRLIIQGLYDDSIGMYTFDLIELITTTDPRIPDSDQPNQALTAKRYHRFKQDAIAKCIAIHQHIGCIPFSTMADNVEEGAWIVDADITPALLRELARRKSCIICAVTRWHQQTFEGSGIPLALSETDVGKFIVLDYIGKITPPSHNCNGLELIGCPVSKYRLAYGLKHKDDALMSAIKQWLIHCLQHGHIPQFILHDGGSVELSAQAEECYARWGLRSIPTPPKISAGIIERMVMTTKEDIEANLLIHPLWTAKNWLDAAIKSTQNRNFCITSSTKQLGSSKTPFELFRKEKPPIQQFLHHGTGDIVVAATPKEESKIGTPRNQLGLVLEVKDDGSRGSVLQMPGKTRALERGHLQKVHIDKTAQPRQVTVQWNADNSEATITTSDNVEVDSAQAIVKHQHAMQKMKCIREEATIKDQIVEAQQLNKDVDKNAHAHAQLNKEEDELADAGVYLPKEQTDYFHQDDASDEAFSSNAAFIMEHSNSRNTSCNMAFWSRVVDNLSNLSREDIINIHHHKELTSQYPDIFDTNCREASIAHHIDQDSTQKDLEESKSKRLRSLQKSFYRVADEDSDDDQSDSPLHDDPDQIAVYQAYAAKFSRAKSREDEPSIWRVMKDPSLQKEWKPAMSDEFNGWKEFAKRISREEAVALGITPHVTRLKKKRETDLDGERLKKARITFNGSFEHKRGFFKGIEHMLFSPQMDCDLAVFLFALCIFYNLRRFSADVKQCFTQNKMEDATFKRALVIHLNEWECSIAGGAYFQINCIVYGCADASMEWHKQLRAFLIRLGMSVSVFHPCLFILRLAEQSIILCGVATDNLEFVFTRDNAAHAKVEWIADQLSKKWPMTYVEESTDMLGMQITRFKDQSGLLSQPNTIQAVEQFFFPSGQAPKTIILEMPDCLRTIAGTQPADVKQYQRGLGVMVYLRCTRNDSKCQLSKKAENATHPTVNDFNALTWLAAYFSTTRQVGLRFFPGQREELDLSKPFPMHAHADAAWNTSEDFLGHLSRLGRMITPGPYVADPPPKRISAPLFAKSGKEQGIPSTSASQAECKSAVLAVSDIQIYRGISEEIAGVADSRTLEDMPPGAAPPTQLRTNPSKQEVVDYIHYPPTVLTQDNRSLVIAAGQDTSKKGKKLRQLARAIEHLRAAVRIGMIEVINVPGNKQYANPLTKDIGSPTQHWREAEYIQGSQPAIDDLQADAARYGSMKRSPRQLKEMIATSAGPAKPR